MAYSVGLDLNDRQYLILRAVPQGFTIMGTTITELTQSYGPIKRIANYTLIRIHACNGIMLAAYWISLRIPIYRFVKPAVHCPSLTKLNKGLRKQLNKSLRKADVVVD